MSLAKGIEMRPCSYTSFFQVAIYVDMEPMDCIWLESFKHALNVSRGVQLCLLEFDNPTCCLILLRSQNANCLSGHRICVQSDFRRLE